MNNLLILQSDQVIFPQKSEGIEFLEGMHFVRPFSCQSLRLLHYLNNKRVVPIYSNLENAIIHNLMLHLVSSVSTRSSGVNDSATATPNFS